MTRADPRTVRTLTRLHRAADELLADKAAGDISVTELCRAAGVHRTTFYAHYNSVVEVVTDVLRQHLVNLLPAGDHAAPRDLPTLRHDVRGELVELLGNVAEHRESIRVLDLSAGLGHSVVMERLLLWVRDVHDAMAGLGAGLPAQREVADRMVAGALTAAVAWWTRLVSDGGRDGRGGRADRGVRADGRDDKEGARSRSAAVAREGVAGDAAPAGATPAGATPTGAAAYLELIVATLPTWWQSPENSGAGVGPTR